MSTAGMLGTLVLIVVLPCAIILCFFLHCYADYLRRNDAQALEAFRVQAQERRMMRQQQIRGRWTSPTTNHQTKLSHKNIKLVDFFYFHTIHKQHVVKSATIPWQDKKNNADKAESEAKKAKGKTIESNRHENSGDEPDGFKLQDEDNDSDDLELCLPCSPETSNQSSQPQPYQSFKDRFFGGSTSSGRKSVVDNKKTSKTSNTNGTSRSEESAPQTQTQTPRTNDSMSKKDGVAEDEDCCCICLERYAEGDVICTTKQKQGDCNHIFHKECLFEWIKQNHDCCPLCRVVLIE
ncbi:MAG: hypothetical protein SGBAC_006966 [Bacillariaceae sp.]